MSVQADIAGLAPDDLTFGVSLTYAGGPLDLSTVTAVTAYLKPAAISPDTDAKTYTIGAGLTVINSGQGQLSWLIPHADTPGNSWYRISVTDATSRLSTAVYGHLNMVAA